MSDDIYAYIRKAGYAPFFSIINSDHQCIIFDIDVKRVLNEDYMHLATMKNRKLKTTVPEKVDIYQKASISLEVP